MNKDYQDYVRSAAFVRLLLDQIRLSVNDLWFPNVEGESGVDVGVTLVDGSLIGIQVTEIDPFPRPSERGQEKKKKSAAGENAYGAFAQNDLSTILRSISRTVEKKSLLRPPSKKFTEIWLLMCAGVPDAPTSTFIPTSPLSAADLDEATTSLLLNSHYSQCFLLPIFGMEKAMYRWRRNGTACWKKSVRIEEIAQGTAGDMEYVRELLRTGGKDKSVVDAQVKRIIEELRGRQRHARRFAGID
jgi:hypothetical protein